MWYTYTLWYTGETLYPYNCIITIFTCRETEMKLQISIFVNVCTMKRTTDGSVLNGMYSTIQVKQLTIYYIIQYNAL